MARPLLPDALWERIEPLLPPVKPRRFRFPGRKPLTHRQALTGILFVLRTGANRNDLPCELVSCKDEGLAKAGRRINRLL
jgi:transposase